MGMGQWNKIKVFAMMGLSLLAVGVTSISTFAWFQINNSVSPNTTGLTHGVSTDAIIHQNAAHPNDDRYATNPVTDAAGTLSYDHSKGGNAVNYYLKVYESSGGSLVNSYQMFSNVSNSADLACYFNINLAEDQAFKIYSAGNAWYGYDNKFSTSVSSAFSSSGEPRFDVVVETAGAYDVYLLENESIWVTPHSDATTSVAQGDKTGYYIVGNASDSNSALSGHSTFATGIPMYVNAAANTSDLAFYAGLRLSAGDSFSVIKDNGDSLMYYAAQTASFWNGSTQTATNSLLNDTTFFGRDSSGNPVITNKSYDANATSNFNRLVLNTNTGTAAGAPTTSFFCKQTGYYNIALSVDQTNSSNPDYEGRDADIHVGAWDGKDVLGTRYTVTPKALHPKRASEANYTITGTGISGLATDWSPANGIKMYSSSSNNAVYYGLTVSKDAKLKITNGVNWDNAVGWKSGTGDTNIVKDDGSNDHNVQFKSAGTYDIYLNTSNVIWVGSMPVGYLKGTFNNWDTADNNYKLVRQAGKHDENEIYKTSVTLSKGDSFKFQYDGNEYGWNSRKTGGGSAINAGYIQADSSDPNSDKNFKVARSGTYDFYINLESLVNPEDGAAIWIQASSVATSYRYNTYKVIGNGEPVSIGSSSSIYESGDTFSAPPLPTDVAYGYDLPTEWNTQPDGEGTSYGVDASVPVSDADVDLYAIYPVATGFTYYFDLFNGAAAGLRNGFKVNAWIQGVGNGVYDAEQVDDDYNTWWKVTVPYNTGLRMQIYAGSNTQSGYISASATNGDIYTVTGWSSTSTTGSWVGRASNGTVQTVSLYKSYDRNGEITDADTPSATYTILNNESWGCSVITSIFTAETGFTTPTVVHAGSSDSPTTYSSNQQFIVTSNVSLYGVYLRQEYTFRLRQTTTVGGSTYENTATGGWNVEDDTVLFADVSLGQGKIWYIDDNQGNGGGATYAACVNGSSGFNLTDDSIGIGVTGITASTVADKDNYFEFGTNCRTLIGGTYDITIDCASKKITSMTLKTVLAGDFVIRGNGAAFVGGGDFTPAGQLSASSTSASGTSIDFAFASTTFNIGDQFKAFRVDASATDENNWSGSFSGSSNFFTNPFTTNIQAGGHLTVTPKVRLNVTTGSFSIVFTSQSETGYQSISFNHAKDAGIYIETTTVVAAGSPDWTKSTLSMMHATSAGYTWASADQTYQAQESPFSTTSGMYLRVIKTHSNGSGNTPTTAADIRDKTEKRYYKTTNDMSSSGFTENAGGYLVVTVSDNFTISLRQDTHANPGRGEIEISKFQGNESIGVEHTVPYWIVGTGKPGSDLRSGDFTIGNGKRLYTYGGNSDSLPAYVGSVGGTGSSSAPYGSGIDLKKGDRFAISTASDKITSFAAASGTGWTSSSGVVEITQSGKYRVWLTAGPTVNIAQVSTSGDIDADGGTNVVGYDKGYGVKTLGMSNGKLNFGGNLDYSLLDAYQSEGYTFVVELNSSYSSSLSGTLSYQITNGNGYAIKARAKTASYSASAFDSEAYTSISASTASAADFHTAEVDGSEATSTTVLIEITIPASVIKSMLASHGTLAFTMGISCTFTESITA